MKSLVEKIAPVWENIETVRQHVEKYLSGYSIDPDVIYSACMTAGELLENAIKYGSENPKDEITVQVEYENDRISLEIRNRADRQSDENLQRLDRAVQWIKSYHFPFEAYIEKLRYVSSRDMEEGESGLGLVRIAFEAHADVDFYMNEDKIICVSAIIPAKLRSSAGR